MRCETVTLVVTDFGEVRLPRSFEVWMNEQPRGCKHKGRKHKESVKARTKAIEDAVSTLAWISWKQGHDIDNVQAVIDRVGRPCVTDCFTSAGVVSAATSFLK